uniref:Uncharacterized protein n=1 Tax=uncultured prokaryote TaxID=198431 RepID=A0A0H5QQ40_9ZZZZ|nr:hypothetical protein [uncultured prokaryote]
MIRIRTVFTGVAGSPYYTNMYFDAADVAAAQDAHDLVLQFWDDIAGMRRSLLSGTVEGVVPVINPATGDITGSYGLVEKNVSAGGDSTDPLPPATQALLTLATGVYVGGRQLQGRTFLPGFGENANAAPGVLRSEYVATINAAAYDLLNTGPDWVVWSRKNGAFEPIQSALVSPKWSVLRSRKD